MWVKRGESGAVCEGKDGGRPANQRHRPAQFPHAKIRKRPHPPGIEPNTTLHVTSWALYSSGNGSKIGDSCDSVSLGHSLKRPTLLGLFPAFEAEKLESCKGYTATRYKCCHHPYAQGSELACSVLAGCVYLWDFKQRPYYLTSEKSVARFNAGPYITFNNIDFEHTATQSKGLALELLRNVFKPWVFDETIKRAPSMFTYERTSYLRRGRNGTLELPRWYLPQTTQELDRFTSYASTLKLKQLKLLQIKKFYSKLVETAPLEVVTFHRSAAAVVERLACSPPTRANRVQSRPGHTQIFACGNHAGRCHRSAGFLGDLTFPPPFHSGAAPYPPQSPSLALKTSLLRAAQISSLTHSIILLWGTLVLGFGAVCVGNLLSGDSSLESQEVAYHILKMSWRDKRLLRLCIVKRSVSGAGGPVVLELGGGAAVRMRGLGRQVNGSRREDYKPPPYLAPRYICHLPFPHLSRADQPVVSPPASQPCCAGRSEVRMKQRRNEKGDPRENPPASGIVRHDSHLRKSGVNRQGIEPGLP
ncbi:hypothetical protein PR048_018045 [Dryococelus australis]|uniref:Uncharacterized protein n=1 Tax=Dryococelus australis TaxID=614101 RepID=A0ABQ9HB68_9NEOP|nr:hypothetical protein PR048_018045 [Dryococelus australis]